MRPRPGHTAWPSSQRVPPLLREKPGAVGGVPCASAVTARGQQRKPVGARQAGLGGSRPPALPGPNRAFPPAPALGDVRRQTGEPERLEPPSEDPLTQERAVPHSPTEKEDFQST